MPELIAVVGPTAIGKSELALRICERFGGELVSVDSMQIYRTMDIGTAKPSPAERARVPHHLIDLFEPDAPCSAASFAALAHKAIADVKARGKIPVLCGGTGLYMDSILKRLSFGEMESDTALREELKRFAEENGVSALHALLEKEDPEAAAAIHENNVKRVIRAIEICRQSGKTKTEWDRLALEEATPYRALRIGLSARNRGLMVQRINERVDKMVEAGVVREAEALWKSGVLDTNATAAGAIGYKEFLPFLRGEESLLTCVETLKTATRHYAKRQLTWFMRDPEIHWFYLEDYPSTEALFGAVCDLLNAERD